MLTVRGIPFVSAQDLFEKCHQGSAEAYALELKKNRYSYDQLSKKGNKIGTIDASSCIGIVYRTPDNTLLVQHHDGRPLNSLKPMLEGHFRGDTSVKVTLIGGCKYSDNYSSLEHHTKDNVEKLIKFWRECQFQIDVQTWIIGQAASYETLYSDFVADDEGIYLLKQGEVGNLNIQMNGLLIPQAARRLAVVISNNETYINLNSIPHTSEQHLHALSHFATQILKLDDATLLKTCSTTPNLEPPYFAKAMREMARFVLSKNPKISEINFLPEHPIFCIQGEIVKK